MAGGLKEFASVLGTSLLAGSGPSGRAAATSLLNNRMRLAEAQRQADIEDATRLDEQKREKFKTALDLAKETLTNQAFLDAAAKEGGKPIEVMKNIARTSLEGLGMNPDLADGFVPSPYGTTKVDTIENGKPVTKIVENRPGQTFEAQPKEPLVGDITVSPIIDMTAKTKSDLESTAVKASNQMQTLSDIKNSFKADYLTVSGKAKAAGLNLMEKLDLPVSAENKKYLKEFTEFTGKSLRNVNNYIHDLTGAQMSVYEADRLRGSIPDPGEGIFGGMGPTKFQANMDEIYAELAIANARAIIMRKQGIEYDFSKNPDKEGPITLEQTRQIINQRGQEIEAGLIAQGKSPEEARKETGAIIRNEYGL